MKRKNEFRKSSENGAALIIALAMLALLLIMLIGFLSSSILEQRIAYSYRDNTGAHLLARSALTRVKAQLAGYTDDLIWMRNSVKSESGKPDIIAPLVSLNSDSKPESGSGEPDGDDTAYKALKPLLRRYIGPFESGTTAADVESNWQWQNVFPDGASNLTYPDWIYFYNNPDKDRITGRMAYVVMPNLGINLNLLKGTAAERKGVKFEEELSSRSYLTASGKTRLERFNKWFSVDVLMGKNGLYSDGASNSYFDTANMDIAENFYSGSLGGKMGSSTVGNYREFASLYFTAREPDKLDSTYIDVAKFNRTGKIAKVFPSYATHGEWKTFVTGNFDMDDSTANQVAANILDYIDTDSLPTSDQDPASWETSAPTYAGNEKTPYINQIVPAVQMQATYTLLDTTSPSNGRTVDQTVMVSKNLRVYVELVNIYPEALTVKNIVLKNVIIDATAEKVINGKTTSKSIKLEQDTVTINVDKSIAPRSYESFQSDIISVDSSLPTNLGVDTTHLAAGAAIPTVEVNVTINSIKFDKAILSTSEGNVDYVSGLTAPDMPRNLTGTQKLVNPDTGTEVDDKTFAWEFNTENATKTASAYASFSVNDPRCNLQESEWKFDWERRAAAFNSDAIPHLGAANNDSDAKNTDLTAEKDLEVESDPAKVSTAYIRNGKLESLREFGLIHRGKAWQTFNLHSSEADPDLDASEITKLTYKTDPLFVERFRMSIDSDYKFNVNYPANFTGAFAPLTTNLGYYKDHPGGSFTVLDADAQKELRKWLANKCYNANGSDPASADAKVYNRYVRHSELANVITDWAINGSKSPLKGDKVTDAYLEELIAQILPLVRFGEVFEYFTVYAVAQSIKDAGGKIYRYDEKGKLESYDAEYGKLDANDAITSTAYFVARLRRKISCKQQADGSYLKSCLWGYHSKECSKTVEVLESYTLTEP